MTCLHLQQSLLALTVKTVQRYDLQFLNFSVLCLPNKIRKLKCIVMHCWKGWTLNYKTVKAVSSTPLSCALKTWCINTKCPSITLSQKNTSTNKQDFFSSVMFIQLMQVFTVLYTENRSFHCCHSSEGIE